MKLWGRSRRRSRARVRGNRRVDRERRVEQQRRVRTGFRIGLVVAILVLAVHHGARLADSRGWLDPFRVREVRVEGITLANPNVLVAEAGLMGEIVHWWTPLHDYVANVERDPFVQSATFHRRFPNGLTLEVVERRPVALIALERLAPVDSAGRVLPVTAFREEFDAPVLTTPWAAEGVARDGSVEHAGVRAMLARLGEIAIHYPVLSREISAIRMESDGAIALTLVHAEGEVVMDHATPLAKLALVDDVVRDLRRKGVSYDRLDLRFEDQIVVRRNGSAVRIGAEEAS